MSCECVPIEFLRAETAQYLRRNVGRFPRSQVPNGGRTTVEGLELLPTILSIVVVLAVLGATLLLLRWATKSRSGLGRRGGRQRQLIEVVERQSLGRNSSLIVIRYGGTEHMLGVTESQITALTEGTIDLRDLDDEDSESRAKIRPAHALEALRNKTVRR
jgi:flagellar biogenesis protein FliO